MALAIIILATVAMLVVGFSILANGIWDCILDERKNQAHRDAYNARVKQIDDEYRAWSGKSLING